MGWDFVCPHRPRALSILEAFEEFRVTLKVPFLWKSLFWPPGVLWITRNKQNFNTQQAS
jgi:hypothetical protein